MARKREPQRFPLAARLSGTNQIPSFNAEVVKLCIFHLY